MSAMRIDGRDATLRLEGEVGRERRGAVVRDVNLALRSCAGIVWLDLGTTRHLHYEVARALVQTASDERRLQMVVTIGDIQQRPLHGGARLQFDVLVIDRVVVGVEAGNLLG